MAVIKEFQNSKYEPSSLMLHEHDFVATSEHLEFPLGKKQLMFLTNFFLTYSQ
jgi:hypothetical protein